MKYINPFIVHKLWQEYFNHPAKFHEHLLSDLRHFAARKLNNLIISNIIPRDENIQNILSSAQIWRHCD